MSSVFRIANRYDQRLLVQNLSKIMRNGQSLSHLFHRTPQKIHPTSYTNSPTKILNPSSSKTASQIFHEIYPTYCPAAISIASSVSLDLSSCSGLIFPPLRKPGYGMTRQLIFAHSKVLVHQDLVIGQYTMREGASHLLAYKKKEHLFQWSVKCEGPLLNYQSTRQNIVMMQKNVPSLTLLDATTGKVLSKPKLPHLPESSLDRLHVTADNFCYYMTTTQAGRVLFGGNLIDGKWEPIFERRTPPGHFFSLGDDVYFIDHPSRPLVTLLNQRGEKHVLENCIDLLFHNGITSTIDQVPGKEWLCYLTTLPQQKLWSVSNLEYEKTRFAIESPSLEILSSCEDGTLICFEKSDFTLSFVNVGKEDVFKIPYSFSSHHDILIDQKNRAIWSWDENTKELHKHSYEGSRRMGKIESEKDISLTYLDDQDVLHYTRST